MAAHRYWRFYVTATAGTYVSASEIELRNSVSGSDLTGSGTASHSFALSGWESSKAFDNNTGTGWATYDHTPPQWISYDFGSGISYDIVEFVITPRTDGFHSETPRDFLFQYSDDNSNWTTVASLTGVTWPSASPQTFSLAPMPVRVSQLFVEVITDFVIFAVNASDTLSLSDSIETVGGATSVPYTISISENFSLTEGTVKAQRKNAPNIPIIAVDQFSDSFEIIGEFGLQLDTMRGQEFAWDVTDVFNLTDAIYSSEYINISAESDFSISDELTLEIALSIEVYDSFQDVWDPEAEIDIEIIFAAPMELELEDSFELSDEIAMFRASDRDVEDRFTLVDSVRVRFERYLEITGDLLALSDALEIGWNPSVEVSDTLSLDDSGGVSTLIPSHIEIEVGVSESRLVVTEGLSLFDGDFSTQGTEVFLGGTRLSYLRRYLNDVPR